MMNKKGQVLVVFVLILPLILMFLGLIIDIGNSLIIKKKNENILKDIIIYTFKDDNNETDIDESSYEEIDLKVLENQIKKNLNNYETLKIDFNDNIIEINVTTKYKSIFGSLFNIGLNKIDVIIKYDTKLKKIVRE